MGGAVVADEAVQVKGVRIFRLFLTVVEPAGNDRVANLAELP